MQHRRIDRVRIGGRNRNLPFVTLVDANYNALLDMVAFRNRLVTFSQSGLIVFLDIWRLAVLDLVGADNTILCEQQKTTIGDTI